MNHPSSIIFCRFLAEEDPAADFWFGIGLAIAVSLLDMLLEIVADATAIEIFAIAELEFVSRDASQVAR